MNLRPQEIEAILRGRHENPFSILGMHRGDDDLIYVNAFAPQAATVEVIEKASDAPLAKLVRLSDEGFFSGPVANRNTRFPYLLRFGAGDQSWTSEDPFRFPPLLGDLDDYLFAEGKHFDLYRRLGAHPCTLEGVDGTAFSVWAPNARRVSVVGDFNAWDGRRHPMRKRLGSGIWEIFIPELAHGARYKLEILGVHGEIMPLKADPVSLSQEAPPATASIVTGIPDHDWGDKNWLAERANRQSVSSPISIYEVHLGSWRRDENNQLLNYDELADYLVDYVTDMGFTHVELMPVTEHPFTGSWGYQPIGLFAPTKRFGTPQQFCQFVDRLHRAGIGVIADWVPAHFPSDTHGLARFDGTALYEHEDPRLGFHQDWNTLIYNFGRTEVANFLQASALYWLDTFHIDALRVDAVASMLYLDYSRKEGEWIPNRLGGNHNLDAVDFLRTTNENVHARHLGALTIAEESTAWPGVSRPVRDGGLGFDFKWNMGWMHDTLEYMKRDPIHRRFHHWEMTFGLLYAYSENFVLPLSHDEVVHGKGSLLQKMPGDPWQKFANLRAYLAFMWAHPGKKLLFMGGEFAQEREWNHDHSLDWHLLADHSHRGIQDLVRDLNSTYRNNGALHELDCDPDGFEWIEQNDADRSIFAFLRKGKNGSPPILAVCNMTPVPHTDYRIGVPLHGRWTEILNSDAERYGGSNVGNCGGLDAQDIPSHGRPASLSMTLPPLATIMFRPERHHG
ncbi:1,4-alpha-glucan branching protein GlgB [Phyllobacterium endophyticum]|uniref:1,4-alpha-glucan branching enzyme GlgB n=1 Tax=Phyllobacterium endophyticum TaxID=1149773 RepID=A0A2P7ANU4_9HYPH|nr:1,4-alpha-glucan branching protein GlgB [Phyllobacterium endophyticum]MBB3233778.1 1,4-alpha-glucan branching enzyme [Phyllobacterium endophyticum]PSH55883.1 1,4-alpha-glucan branching enzyme [Phyllobacterium endophyticum]TYR41023.1 1,4-alpha-glucan branching protein GlgB [Phyllobacterium endophyticum]